ncbi:MAG: type I-U CRISPR-associated protein Csx17 [Armatimonadota bacterium]|nr:type I-U CRISPR-associated protein Csx17 [Armatimonadota bacterium]
MPEVRLSGCRPEPLGSYLKALGVLKVVGTQCDPEALGWWEGDQFVLASSLSEDELVRFFSEDYRPIPMISAWNLDSGFYAPGTAIDKIEQSTDPRLEGFRQAVATARQVLSDFGWANRLGPRAKKAQKKAFAAERRSGLPAFVAALRSRLPEDCVDGLDAIVALTGDDPSWAPLFVDSGRDGRFEFTRRYAEAVLAALGIVARERQGARRPARASAVAPGIRMALFGDPEQGVADRDTGGLLVPGSVDAPNASQGFVGQKRLNPWDYVLALEGAVLLAGSVFRRWGSQTARASFPFAVEASAAGYVGAGSEASKGEVWLPLWGRPLTAREVRQLFREGRAEWAGRPATTAADMARAIISLGVDRGIQEFRRHGIQLRSGRSHLAVSMGRWPVVARPEAPLLAELDEFLGAVRQRASQRDAPAALVAALRRLEAAILDYAAVGGRDRLTEVLAATAYAELTLARRPGLRTQGRLRPLSGLSPAWVPDVDDGSVEFELAAAIASLRSAGEGPGPFRRHLEPLDRRRDRWEWAEEMPREVVWSGRDVLRDMAAVLERRLVDATRVGVVPPLDGWVRAHPSSVAALLDGEVDLDRLARLCEALALVEWGPEVRLAPRDRALLTAPAVPSSYAVLKLALLGRPLRVGELSVEVRPDQTTLGLLRAGDVWGATVRAARRLRAAGLTVGGIPLGGEATPVRPDPGLGRRILAALLIPVQEGPLVSQVQVREEDKRE